MIGDLTPDQMLFLQQQNEKELKNKISEYNQMYNPLAQTVAAAKQLHQGMSSGLDEDNPEPVDDGGHDKVMGKKHQLEHMLKDYFHESEANKRLKKKRLATKKKLKNDK